jgi:hypothetical protein
MLIRLIVIQVLICFALVSCSQRLSDPVLKDRLTTMIVQLHVENGSRTMEGVSTTLEYLHRVVPPIADNLDAIMAVNASKMNNLQRQKLADAKSALKGVQHEFELTATGQDTASTYSECLDSLARTRQLLIEAAEMF